MGHLLKVEESSGALSTFKSYLRILVEIDSNKTLNPSFSFSKQDGYVTWISLKYERLDAYCSDCGLLGYKQPFCLAPQTKRFPKRYKISPKVNIFSNLQPAFSLIPHAEKFPSSAPFRLGQKNISNIPLKPIKNLPPYQTHNPTTKMSTHHIHICPIPSTAGKIDILIHIPLNALSLFQKPIPLFSTTPTNYPLVPNQHSNQTQPSNIMDPTIKKPTSPHLAFSTQHIQPTSPSLNLPKLTNLSPLSSFKAAPTKRTNSHTTIHSTRKSPYNIRPPKKPSLTLKDDSSPSNISSPSSPSSLSSRKRQRTSHPSTPSKKGPGSSSESTDPLTPTQTIFLSFFQGFSEIVLAHAIFKAA